MQNPHFLGKFYLPRKLTEGKIILKVLPLKVKRYWVAEFY